MKNQTNKLANATGSLIILLALSVFATAQTSVFTFQGRLNDNSLPANGTYEMQFSLYDAVSGGNQISTTTELTDVSVINGIFTVRLDFGATAFDGNDRFIEISVRRNATESYTTLAPRQFVTSVPYAIMARNASTANTANTAASADFATSAGNANTLGGLGITSFVTGILTSRGLIATRIGGTAINLQTRVSNIYTVFSDNLTTTPNSITQSSPHCLDAADIAINGGVFFVGHDSSPPNFIFAQRLEVLSSAPSTIDQSRWFIYFRNPTGNALLYRRFVVCLSKNFD